MRFSVATDVLNELSSVLHGYPRFVFSRRAGVLSRHLPVFIYHDVDPLAFERDLRFLAENGYRTVGMSELMRHLDGSAVADRAVVLTFDDARSSFWRYGYPLLRRHGMKGVLFVIPGMTLPAASCRPTLLDIEAGAATAADVADADPEDVTLCTWPELKHMHASGCVEIESHSLFHQEVFVAKRFVGFLGPDSSYAPFLTPATAYLTERDVGRPLEPAAFFGLPLFESAPLHAGLRAFEPTTALRERAVDIWQSLSDEESRPGVWQRALQQRWSAVELDVLLRQQTAEDVERRMTADLDMARSLLKEHIDPAAGQHFCLPYGAGSEVSLRAAERLGIASCSWCVIDRKPHNLPGDSPLRIGRIKSDFLWRLPGAGRRTLVGIYGRKIGRRLRGERVY